MLSFAVDVLAAHRLIRLATKDYITRPIRQRFIAEVYASVSDLVELDDDGDEYQLVADPTVTGDAALRRVADAVIESRGGYDAVMANTIRQAFTPDADVDWERLVVLDRFPPTLATLATCRWCAGFWVAVFVIAARAVAPRWWDPVAKTLAVSSAATLLSRAETD